MENKELIDLCKQGNGKALGLLYTTYADKMMQICLRYVSDEQTAQDLLHDGFLIIFSSLHTLRSPEKLESWMGKIMKNIALQYLKESRPTSITLESITESEEPAESMFSTDFPTYEHLLKTIETLPQGYRNVFKLAVLENLSHKEIAALLGMPEPRKCYANFCPSMPSSLVGLYPLLSPSIFYYALKRMKT